MKGQANVIVKHFSWGCKISLDVIEETFWEHNDGFSLA